jgi:hypothetical protein
MTYYAVTWWDLFFLGMLSAAVGIGGDRAVKWAIRRCKGHE